MLVQLLEGMRSKLVKKMMGQMDSDTIGELRTLANREAENRAPAATASNHDDRVIALALALRQSDYMATVS